MNERNKAPKPRFKAKPCFITAVRAIGTGVASQEDLDALALGLRLNPESAGLLLLDKTAEFLNSHGSAQHKSAVSDYRRRMKS